MHRDPETDAPAWDAAPQGRSLIQVLWHRKAFVLLGAFLGLALAFLWHTQRPPVYQSSCQLLLIQKQKIPLADAADPSKQFYEDYTPTHMALLRSPLILERAVKKGDLTALRTFENGGDPVGMLQANLIAGRDTKETGGSPSNILLLSMRGPISEDTGKALQAVVDSYQQFLDETYRFVNDQTYELMTKAHNIWKNDLDSAEKKYAEFRKKSPTIFTNREGLSVEQKRVTDVEAERTKFELKKLQLRERIASLEKAIAVGKGMDLLAALPKAEQTSDGKSVASERYINEPLLLLKLKEQELLQDFGQEHPAVKNVRDRIQLTREFLSKLTPEPTEKDPAKRALAAMQWELSETELALASTGEIVEKLKNDARALMNYEIEENHLRNDVSRLQQLYDGTIKRLQHIEVGRDSGGFLVQQLSRPAAGVKVAPIAWQDLALGLIAGLLLGGGLAYVAEISDKSFRNPEEVRRRLGLPLVGHIPFIAPDPESERKRAAGEACADPLLCTFHRPKSLEAEAYRAVRTALFFATQGLGHKVIQVTSPNKSDGKSLMIANLAAMVAQSGKQVLLLDADLRRPRQHRIFAVDASTGLAEVLDGTVEPHRAISATCVPGLSVLPCGAVPPNPAELLTSPRFKELLETMRARYDYVLIDTPPLLAVTDPCVVAARADGVFLTLRLTRKGRPNAERAREILAGLNAKILGVVVNGVTRGAGGIHSPHAYDYTESYGQEEPGDEQDYYYDEEEAIRSNGTTAAATANGSSGNGPGGSGGKGFWRRWWPAS
jgi:capsular exopolysaccharide synthesis family protein